MSQEEQVVEMGRALSEYAEVKRKLAALLSQAERIEKAIYPVSYYFRPTDQYSRSSLRDGGSPPDLSEFPTREQLDGFIQETLQTMQRKKELQARLKEFGAEPKD